MEPKIHYFILADYVVIDEKTKKLCANGFFDTFRNSIFPAKSPKFSIVIGVSGTEGANDFIVEMLTPDGEKFQNAQFSIESSSVDIISNIIVNVEAMPLPERGKYVVKIYHKEGNFLLGSYFFMADYFPERNLSSKEIQQILNDPTLSKSSKIELECPKCNSKYSFELNLDSNKKISEGFLPFPMDNKIKCCGKVLDLTGLRRQIEWEFGKKLMG